MSKIEFTGERDLSYNLFHRDNYKDGGLQNRWDWAYYQDLDGIEYRFISGKPVPTAIIETKATLADMNLNNSQIELIKYIAEKLAIPAYLIRHNIRQIQKEFQGITYGDRIIREYLYRFRINDIRDNNKEISPWPSGFTVSEWKNFIKTLH